MSSWKVMSSAELIKLRESGRVVRQPMPNSTSYFREVKIKEEPMSFVREEEGTDYAVKYQMKEQERLNKLTANLPLQLASNSSNSSPQPETQNGDDEEEDEEMQFGLVVDEVEQDQPPELTFFNRYEFGITPQDVPIKAKRDEILDEINRNIFIVLTASTGTGKSSQIPQYILEDAYKSKQNCNIVVTQPRRIAAISIAKRVAIERKCECGTLVGYQVGMERKIDTQTNSDTRIMFCTTGVLLQKLVNEKCLQKFTHIIIDEIHERDINIDMLLIIIRRLIATNRGYNVKIILMSATINEVKISNYFKTFKQYDNQDDFNPEVTPAPIMNLEINRPFKIIVNYLDDLMKLMNKSSNFETLVQLEKPGISDDLYQLALKTFEFIIFNGKAKYGEKFCPSFLIFLPGIHEIKRFKNLLYQPCEKFDIKNFKIFILHSSYSSENYQEVYAGEIKNKIILATNMAESSVTLPGVRFVIDFCLTKYDETDSSTNMIRLKLDWASKSSLKQREGRVGRMEDGQVIRLITKSHYDQLPEETKPEILRKSLEFAVLKTKQLDLGKPAAVLALALDPPDKKKINDAIISLKEIGALTRYNDKGKFDKRDGHLTFIGQIMSKIPVDFRIAKLIVLGYVFRCLKECVIIGAGLSSRGIFTTKSTTAKDKLEEYHQKMKFSRGSGSDLIAILNAYNSWREAKNRGLEGSEEYMWCQLQFLSLKNLREMHEQVEDVKERLKFFQMNFEDFFPLNEYKKLAILKMCIAGAFYPNYFTFAGENKRPGREEMKTLNNMNPCTTVYYKKFKGRLGKIYEQQIIDKLEESGIMYDASHMKLHFDGKSERFQVEFKYFNRDDVKLVPGDVKFEVYKALKLQSLHHKLKLDVMDRSNEVEFAIENQLASYINSSLKWHEKKLQALDCCIYPKYTQSKLSGTISHIVDCSKFFFQTLDGEKNIEKLFTVLGNNVVRVPISRTISHGSLQFVKHQEIIKRAKVLEVPEPEDNEQKFNVYLIDFGEVVTVNLTDFFMANNDKLMYKVFELPPQCFECKLSGIIPSPIECPTGWSEKSIEVFKNFIESHFYVEVKSFVDRVALVEIAHRGETLNDRLIMQNFAIASDDSYVHLLDQYHRMNAIDSHLPTYGDLDDEFNDASIISPAPLFLSEECEVEGPFSILMCDAYKLAPNITQKSLDIDVSSINDILIDPYPFDSLTKVLVAASMSEKETKVSLGQTTILPHIPGMATFVSLIFSPVVEMRRNSKKNRFSNILCGLGCHDNMKSVFGEHDMVIDNDVHVSDEDLQKINDLRLKMSQILKRDIDPQMNARLRDQVCTLMIDILSEKRDELPVFSNSDVKVNWKINRNVKLEDELIYAPHDKPEPFVPLTNSVKQILKENLAEIVSFSRGSSDKSLKCLLCNEELETNIKLKTHLLTKLHISRTMKLRDEFSPI